MKRQLRAFGLSFLCALLVLTLALGLTVVNCRTGAAAVYGPGAPRLAPRVLQNAGEAAFSRWGWALPAPWRLALQGAVWLLRPLTEEKTPEASSRGPFLF
ncbi:MAG: hypothetical protein PHD67_01930 [Oscillospiraceae bacterium]|nr:hypothetical protein [Oscillospiraceae bacterium]